jgi:NAD(P)-dependent dehydrogenase (short-subunit alcohol dehydrogenase family)
MSHKKVWFITGASRGMGVDFAKAAPAAGHAVVASGRDSDRLSKAGALRLSVLVGLRAVQRYFDLSRPALTGSILALTVIEYGRTLRTCGTR